MSNASRSSRSGAALLLAVLLGMVPLAACEDEADNIGEAIEDAGDEIEDEIDERG